MGVNAISGMDVIPIRDCLDDLQMSLQRQVRKLNRILLSETGQNPIREWMHSSDTRLLHPMRVFERDGSVVYDYHCRCGKNVRVHGPECRITQPKPRWEMWHLLDLSMPKEKYADCWLVGCRTFPDQSCYVGCPFPSAEVWYPFSDRAGVLILNQGTPPSEDLNWELVKMIREWNDLHSTMDQAHDESQLLHKRAQNSKIEAAMRDAISVSSRPGAKEEVSFPSTKDVGEKPWGSVYDKRIQFPVKPPLRSNQRTEFVVPSLLSQN